MFWEERVSVKWNARPVETAFRIMLAMFQAARKILLYNREWHTSCFPCVFLHSFHITLLQEILFKNDSEVSGK
jgi:hypothetical protein